ncbi:MAG: hypothetical protein CMI09_14355 [Oceanospirillaceae bacterium]|nr:hypothetical protein [Oceanospirillaceae bacterium]
MMNPQDILAMTEFVEQQGLSEQTLSQLRDQYEGHHFTWCMEDDINVGKPYLERPTFKLYLVDSRDHCSTLTNDEEIASGLVFAECVED